MIIQVKSSGFEGENLAEISINGKVLEMPKNENDHFRGLHIAIINQHTGAIIDTKVFDTYSSQLEFNSYISRGEYVKEGNIVAVACKDDCTKKLVRLGHMWFEYMGSEEISKLQFR